MSITEILYSKVLSRVDIDECARNISDCNQTCSNTPGSYDCSCDSGFNLADDELDCIGQHTCYIVLVLM